MYSQQGELFNRFRSVLALWSFHDDTNVNVHIISYRYACPMPDCWLLKRSTFNNFPYTDPSVLDRCLVIATASSVWWQRVMCVLNLDGFNYSWLCPTTTPVLIQITGSFNQSVLIMFELVKLLRITRKRVFGHMGTVKLQISLRIWAVYSLCYTVR